MSLLKYKKEQNGNGRGRLFWGRSDVDQLPIRGPAPLMLKEDEFLEYAERVFDARVAVFNIMDPGERAEYQAVIERIASGWYKGLYVERLFDDEKKLVYMEWLECYLEIPSNVYTRVGHDHSGTRAASQEG